MIQKILLPKNGIPLIKATGGVYPPIFHYRVGAARTSDSVPRRPKTHWAVCLAQHLFSYEPSPLGIPIETFKQQHERKPMTAWNRGVTRASDSEPLKNRSRK